MKKNTISNDIMDLKDKIFKHKMKIKKLERKIECLRNACNHEIIVITKEAESNVVKGMKIRSKTKCLICGDYLAPKKYMPKEILDKIENAVALDFNDYIDLPEKWEKTGYEELRSYYFLEKIKNEEMDEFEIGKRIKERLEEDLRKEGAIKKEE